jgi:isoleucyl-tRNA synthetase
MWKRILQREAPERSVDVEIAIQLKEENKAFKVEKYAQLPTLLENRQAYFVLSFDSWFIKFLKLKTECLT